MTGKPLIISRELFESPYVINMPKMKAHAQMKMTGAVKNMFGAVVGKRKALLHMQSKNDVMTFARMVLETCYAAAPMLTVVDGIMSLSERGPRNGKPFSSRILIMGKDPVRIDCLLAYLIGVEPDVIFTNRAAKESGIGQYVANSRWGRDMESYRLAGFQLPEDLTPIAFRPLRVLKSLFKHLIAKWK